MTDHDHDRSEVRDNQAPQYQAPETHDTAYQPQPQGDAGHYQPHMKDEAEVGGLTSQEPGESFVPGEFTPEDTADQGVVGGPFEGEVAR